MNPNQITPVGKRVLIRPYEGVTKSASGLVIESTSNTSNAPVRGTIISVGEESKFKKGQEVLWRRFSLDTLKFVTAKGEEQVSLAEDDDIIAIIKTNKK